MAVTIRTQANATSTTGTTITVAKGSTADGDVVVLRFTADAPSVTQPTGFVPVHDTDASTEFGYAWGQETWLKVITDAASEPTSWQFTTAGSTYKELDMLAVIGCDPAAPLAGATENVGAGTTATGLSVTAGRDGSLAVHYSVSAADPRTGGAGGAPSGMTNLQNYDTNVYVDVQALDAGATGNKTSAYAASQGWLVHMLVLQPEASGGSVALTGSAAGVAVAAGTLSPAVSIPLTGVALGVAVAAGSVSLSESVQLTGAAIEITAVAGTVTPSVAAPLGGSGVGVAVTAGTLSPAVSIPLTGVAIGVGVASGSVAPAVAPALTGAASSVATGSGTLSPAVNIPLTGVALGVAVAEGNVAPPGGVAVELTGVALGVALAAGTVAPAVAPALSGAGAGVAVAAGSLAPAVTPALAGSGVGVAVAAGTLSPAVSIPLTGVAVGVGVAAGNLSLPGLVALTGSGVGVAVVAGTLSPAVSIPLTGVALGVGVAAGSVSPAVSPALSGAEVGVAVSTGALTPVVSAPLTGVALGVAVAAGNLSSGEPVTVALTGVAIGVAVAAGELVAIVGPTLPTVPATGSLMAEIARTLQSVLDNVADFATAAILTAPDGTAFAISGLYQDIGLSIDPDTGLSVQARKATLVVSTLTLMQQGIVLPRGQDSALPWLVTLTPPTGSEITLAVQSAIPDKLGSYVLALADWVG